MNLRELINQKFDTDYPISGGTGNSVENPIIIGPDERSDLDYQVVQRGVLYCIGIAKDISWELMGSQRIEHNGRSLDQLLVEVRKQKDGLVTTSKVNYYFDVTDCLC